jgi:uncharacterized repeat protein (TIGR01451 family)
MFCPLLSPVRAQTAPDHPNIVIILTDDLGYGDVSYNGCPDYQTPNIDALASKGIWCSNGYVTHPFCSPSRAGLLTGRYQQRFGHENQPETTALSSGLPLGELLLPQILKPAGYVSGLIGKWHLGANFPFGPLQRGFDEFYGFLQSQSTYFNAPLFRNDTAVTETEYLTDGLTREAVSFIDRHTTQPFFLYLAYNAPHSPYQAPQSYLDRVANISDPNRRTYAAMITALDDGIGKVMQALSANSLTEKTLIFFLSDNGAPDNGFTRNAPLSGWKLDTLEGGIRVPFAIQWTGHLPAHVVYGNPVSSLDIVATVANAAGAPLPSDRPYDGLDLMPYLTGQQSIPQRTLFWRWFGLGASGPRGSVDTIYAARQGSLKLVRYRALGASQPQLYDLGNDIAETQDLSLSRPGDAQSLKALYNQWETQLIAPLWAPSNQWVPTSIVLVGDWNGFSKIPNPPWAFTTITAPDAKGTPDGYNWFTTIIKAAASAGDTTAGVHSFAVIANRDYHKQWGGVTINVDGTTTIPSFSGTSLGPTNTITLENGFYYSFRVLDEYDPTDSSLRLATMKTSAAPIAVSRRRQIPTTPTPNDSVTIEILTSQPKSLQERIYLRWSTDTFVTSHMTEAVGTNVTYSAQIPPQPAGTMVQYCITTSTVDLSQVSASGAIDPVTLATTPVYKFVSENVGTPPPPPPPTPPPTPTPTATPMAVSADLKITVGDSKTAIVAGAQNAYTIVVTNPALGTVSGASVTDNFPAMFGNVSYTAAQVGGASGFTASGTGNINDKVVLPAGSKITYAAKGKVSSAATGNLVNTATVALPNGVSDPNPANNSATDSDSITYKADLKVTVSDGKAAAVAGTRNTYTIVVTNAGPSNVAGAVIQDNFPAAFTGVTFTATQTGGASGFMAAAGGSIHDTVTMPAGSKITYKATGTITASATGSISNTASVTSPGGVPDPNFANNSATDTDTL